MKDHAELAATDFRGVLLPGLYAVRRYSGYQVGLLDRRTPPGYKPRMRLYSMNGDRWTSLRYVSREELAPLSVLPARTLQAATAKLPRGNA